MTAAGIKTIIAQGEGINIEFKAAKSELPQNIYETVCAFLNREGGHILLGVEDDGTISGVSPKSIAKMLDTLSKGVNNPQLLEPTFYLGHEVVDMGDETVVVIYVPASSQAHRYKGTVYDRSSDGDFKVKNQKLISALYIRKQESYTENRIFPYLDIEDFDSEMLDLARKLLSLRAPCKIRRDEFWKRIEHKFGA